MFLNRGFVYVREIIQKSLTLDSGKFVDFIQMFACKLYLQSGVGFMNL